ncbi:MAG TPA: AAA family ATPase [Candidatus Thermoplasmatota archaeon]|nr:AAA family ATPase [Candidatus Thermoplasmatota archaeon]
MRVIAFTGLPGAGKTVAADVAREMGLPVARMGDCVWDEVRARELPLTEENVARVAREMRERHGPAIWAKLTLGRVAHRGYDLLVVDGVRSPDEVDHLRATLRRDFLLVAVVADEATRWRRIQERKRHDETADHALFAARDAREKAFGIERAMAAANVTIHNDGGLEPLRASIRAILETAAGGKWPSGGAPP